MTYVCRAYLSRDAGRVRLTSVVVVTLLPLHGTLFLLRHTRVEPQLPASSNIAGQREGTKNMG